MCSIVMAAPRLPILANVPHAAMTQQAYFLAQEWLVPRLKLERQTVRDVQGIREITLQEVQR